MDSRIYGGLKVLNKREPIEEIYCKRPKETAAHGDAGRLSGEQQWRKGCASGGCRFRDLTSKNPNRTSRGRGRVSCGGESCRSDSLITGFISPIIPRLFGHIKLNCPRIKHFKLTWWIPIIIQIPHNNSDLNCVKAPFSCKWRDKRNPKLHYDLKCPTSVKCNLKHVL